MKKKIIAFIWFATNLSLVLNLQAQIEFTKAPEPPGQGEGGGINFDHGTWKEILAKAKKEDKLVFVDVYTSWCGPCKQMSKEVFVQKMAGDVCNTSFINYKIDAEKGEGTGIAKKYGVVSYPTYLYVNGDGVLFYRSGGSMPLEKFLQESANALTEFKDPMPLPLWEAQYEGKKNDKKFVWEYLKKRQKLGLANGDLLDRYASLCTKEELLQKEIISSLLENENQNVDGAFYIFLLQHKEEVYKQAALESMDQLNGMLMWAAQMDISRAITKRDKKLLDKIIAALLSLPADNSPIEWRGEEARIRFYTKTKEEKELIDVLKRYSAMLLNYDGSIIRKADSVSLQKFNQAVANGEMKDWQPEQIESSRKFYGEAESMGFAYRFGALTQAAFNGVNDKRILTEALQWSEAASQYSGNFSILETKAGLLYKLGRVKEALAVQEKALSAFDSMKMENLPIQQRLQDELQKMKEGKQTWGLEQQSSVSTKI